MHNKSNAGDGEKAAADITDILPIPIYLLGHWILITYKTGAVTSFIKDGQKLREIQ